MKIKRIILVTILALGQLLCFGQTDQTKKELESIQVKSKKDSPLKQDSPLYVLKVDDKLLEFDARKNENLDFEAIDPTSIESISVLKGNEAKDKYGDQGQSGVVVITFKDFNLLSKELQTKFIESNKK